MLHARENRARLALAIAALALASGCAGDDAGQAVARAVEEGRIAFVGGDYPGAMSAFEEALRENPTDPEAMLGLARSAHELHLYDSALERYRMTLVLAPGNARAWEGYLGALVWGGILEGNGRRLGAALDSAVEALSAAPGAPDAYDYVRTGAAELNRLLEYTAILAEVRAAHPDHPVVQIEQARAVLEAARRDANAGAMGVEAGTRPPGVETAAERVAALEERLGAELDALRARNPVDADALYKLAVGYELLDDTEAADAALARLERADGGRLLAAPLLHDRYLTAWVANFEEPVEERLALTERWLPRLEPAWPANPSRYRAILDMQFDLLVDSAGEGVGEEAADRIAATARRLGRYDTWGSAQTYVRAASVLARTPSHYVVAVRITDEGIEALAEDRPGLIYPGTPDGEREPLRLRYQAALMQLQGQALHNLGRDDAAERVLREAIGLYPVAASFAVLGGLLLDQGRDAEAFDLLVAALAHGFGPAETLLMEQTAASAREAALGIGADPGVIDAAVAFARERVEEERDREIVADPLDIAAPDFDLDDTEGRTWRLSELVGKVVVLNYWATWCGPCIAEMPYYAQLVQEYADAADVVFLAISTDEDPSVVPPFLAERDVDFTVLYDQASAVDFQVTGIPASFVIGPDGRIKYRTSGFPGPDRYLREMRLRIDALRPEPRSATR